MVALQPQFEHTAAQYDDYAKQQRMVLQRLVEKVTPHIQDGAKVLDAGCGTGYLSRHLAHEELHWDLLGCDIAFAMCEQAGGAVNASIEFLPFADDSVDACFSSLTLQWVEQPENALAEFNRVLKPGGWLALSTYIDGTLRELHNAQTAVGYPVRPFVNEASLHAAVQAKGFEIDQAESDIFQTQHDGVMGLLRELKGLGSNRYYPKDQKVMSAAQIRQLEQHYLGTDANWQVAYVIARKPV